MSDESKVENKVWRAVSLYFYLRFITRLWTISECKVHCKKTYAIAACLYCIVFIDVALFTLGTD